MVTNDLHYEGSLINYRRAAEDRHGCAHRAAPRLSGWTCATSSASSTDKTKLIAIALVSNVNGYLHEIKKISELAHAHGAYVYADVIQAAGAVPIDVGAMGIDFPGLLGLQVAHGRPIRILIRQRGFAGYGSEAPADGGKNSTPRRLALRDQHRKPSRLCVPV